MTRYDAKFAEVLGILAANPVFDPSQAPLKFFMEDIYTDNLNVFVQEYDAFCTTGRSAFFFKANVLNLALLLRHYHVRGFDDYFCEHSRGNLSVDQVHTVFQRSAPTLRQLLRQAYTTCRYTDVLALYRAYLEFYDEAVGTALTDLNIDFYTRDEQIIAQPMRALLAAVDDGRHFTYLSCIHAADAKQTRFYMTRILEGHIGLRALHGGAIISTIGSLAHDFYFHGNLARVGKLTPDILRLNRAFILRLYNETSAASCEYGLHALHIIQNEGEHDAVVTFDPDFWSYFCYIKNTRFILKEDRHSLEAITGFLDFLTDKPYKITDFNEEGRGYTIKVN